MAEDDSAKAESVKADPAKTIDHQSTPAGQQPETHKAG